MNTFKFFLLLGLCCFTSLAEARDMTPAQLVIWNNMNAALSSGLAANNTARTYYTAAAYAFQIGDTAGYASNLAVAQAALSQALGFSATAQARLSDLVRSYGENPGNWGMEISRLSEMTSVTVSVIRDNDVPLIVTWRTYVDSSGVTRGELTMIFDARTGFYTEAQPRNVYIGDYSAQSYAGVSWATSTMGPTRPGSDGKPINHVKK